MSLFKKKAPALLLAFALACTATACSTPQDKTAAPQPPTNTDPNAAVAPFAGKQAPDFTLKTLSGQEVTLSALKGKKVFLNFWASWCEPCRSEMPDLQKMSRTYEDQVALYGINVTNDDTKENAERFMLELSLTFPSLLDETGKTKGDYRVLGLPVSLTIDEDGRVLERRDGELKGEQMQQMFEHLINSRPTQ